MDTKLPLDQQVKINIMDDVKTIENIEQPSNLNNLLNSASPVVKNALLELKNLWLQDKNPNAVLFSYLILKEPHLVEDTVVRAKKSKLGHNLKKSFLDRLVNKLMNNNKHSTGKKVKLRNLICETMKELNLNMTFSTYILLSIVKSVPNYDIRRQKYGSGHLTRCVRLTISRKIVWYLNVISKHIKSQKPRGNLKSALLLEFKDLMSSMFSINDEEDQEGGYYEN